MLSCAEINSAFHRPHAAATYSRWAASTPPRFTFAVKMPRTITHDAQLRGARRLLERFLEETSGLGAKRGPLLVQLPPSLSFDRRVAARFFDLLRARFTGPVVCEPRHATWFGAAAGALLVGYQVARVAADPPPVPGADRFGGWPGIVYHRLHGAPRKYWSAYDGHALTKLVAAIDAAPTTADVWVIFDNTASGAALENAWQLSRRLAAAR